MEPRCKDITGVTLPAIRASVAEVLHSKYSYTQKEIAGRLGIVQVAVSKYLRGRYSAKIKSVKKHINDHGFNSEIIAEIVNKRSRNEIDSAIDRLCEKLAASYVE